MNHQRTISRNRFKDTEHSERRKRFVECEDVVVRQRVDNCTELNDEGCFTRVEKPWRWYGHRPCPAGTRRMPRYLHLHFQAPRERAWQFGWRTESLREHRWSQSRWEGVPR